MPEVIDPPYKTPPHNPYDDDDDGVALLERAPAKVKPPKRWQVMLLNDDFTPMEFVVHVLQEYFDKDQDAAVKIMLQIHTEGQGVCGVYTEDIAATKANQVMDAASDAGHPLQCTTLPLD